MELCNKLLTYKTITDIEHFPTPLKSSSILPETTTLIQTFFFERNSKIQIGIKYPTM